jgi:uncharacterized protein (TIGR03066 family)
MRMRVICFAVLSVAMVVFAGTARAQDENAKKIIGAWEVSKAAGDLQVGTLIEFTKEGKLIASLKASSGEAKVDGTYRIEKDKLMISMKLNNEIHEMTTTIKKLTDDALEIEDKDKKVDIFRKKKKP